MKITLPPMLAGLGDFARHLLARCLEADCRQTAASLTYTTLLSLAPLVTIGVMAFSAFPVFERAMIELKIFLLTHLVPQAAGQVISIYMHQFSQNAGKLTAVGMVGFAVTAMMLLLTIERTLNQIWHVNESRPWSTRLLTYWALLTVGPVVLGGSLWLSSYLVSVPMGWVPQLAPATRWLVSVMPLLLLGLGFAMLYWMVPNRFVPFKHALLGGAVAGLGFMLLGRGFAWYWVHFNTYNVVYGTFAMLPAFLVWVYMSWWVVVFGAVLTASLGNWRRRASRTDAYPFTQMQLALDLLCSLYRHQLHGQPVQLFVLARELGCAVDAAESTLQRLRQFGWVVRVPRQGWILQKSAEAINLAQLYRELLVGNSQVDGLLADIQAQMEQRLDMSLHDYCAGPAAVPAQ